MLHGDTADKLIVTARVGRRAARPRRDRTLYRGRRSRGVIAPRLSDPGRSARRRITLARCGSGRGCARRAGRGFAADRARRRRGDRRALRRGGRRDGGDARADGRIPEDTPAIRPEIGSFQILQHRAVDMLIALEQARSMAMFATMMAGEEDASERRNAIAAAKVQIGRSGKFIGQQAIQLHGGIGMTMEYKVGHYFKRMTMIDMMFGDADYHLRELARRGASPVGRLGRRRARRRKMIISCPVCSTRYLVDEESLRGREGRTVRCASCGHTWHQTAHQTAHPNCPEARISRGWKARIEPALEVPPRPTGAYVQAFDAPPREPPLRPRRNRRGRDPLAGAGRPLRSRCSGRGGGRARRSDRDLAAGRPALCPGRT